MRATASKSAGTAGRMRICEGTCQWYGQPCGPPGQSAFSVTEVSERERAGEFQRPGAGPGFEALLDGGPAAQHAGEPGPPDPAAGLLRDQGAGGEVVFVQAAFAVGIVGPVGHQAEVQGRGSQPADVGEAVHQPGEALGLFRPDRRIVAETGGQDLSGPARRGAIEGGAVPVLFEPGALA